MLRQLTMFILCPRPMSLCPWVALNLGSLPMVVCFGKGHYHPLLMPEAHASHNLVSMMAPYHISSFLDVATWPCTLVRSILHHVLSQICCCYIPMLHLSNKPWHCTHGSSSRLTQGIVPLCHCREGSSHHASCHCHHEFPITICRGAHVWVPIRLALCVLLVLEPCIKVF